MIDRYYRFANCFGMNSMGDQYIMDVRFNPNMPWLCRILRITPFGKDACKGLDAIAFLQFFLHGSTNVPWMGRSIIDRSRRHSRTWRTLNSIFSKMLSIASTRH